jgi:two-component system NtrC family response regulator
MLILRHKEHLTIEDFTPMEQSQSSDRDGGQSTPLLNMPEEGVALEEIERQAIVEALHRHGGNQTRAAAFLRIPRHTLIYRMEKYGIKR